MQKRRLLGKHRVFTILVVAAGALVLASCTRTDRAMVAQLSALQAPGGGSAKVQTVSLQELRSEVARYQAEVNRIYASTQKLGRAYEMLALKYFNGQMYGPALRSFKEAIQIYPTNPVLLYMAGICQGQLGKVETNPQKRTEMFEQAATYYENALALSGSYKDALYALAVLDVFELNKPQAAKPLLEKLLSLTPHDTKAQFLLARVYAGGGDPQKAAALYDRIISGNATAVEKAQAEQNKRTVLEGAYGK